MFNLVFATLLGFFLFVPSFAKATERACGPLRVLSWNVSLDAFEDEPVIFHALLTWAAPDLVLLDEVDPQANLGIVRDALAALTPDRSENWTVSIGASGGNQRGVIASRFPQQVVSELATLMPYPEADRRRLERPESGDPRDNLAVGIGGHGAILETERGSLLVVATDLRCCGDGPESRQEDQRRVESRELRRRIRQVIDRTTIDAILIAGDFNTVAGPAPLEILSGPYPQPHGMLLRATPIHPDGVSSWTWDGRGTPYPSGVLDHQLYSPASLQPSVGLVLDTESATLDLLERLGLETESSRLMGDHRPLLVEYTWTAAGCP
jgi:endonuclease/exonuclease/phosphatase family metal-dependent hydrolase